MLEVPFFLTIVSVVLADDPIVHLFAQCPSTDSAMPTLHLTTDVPAYAMARCRNSDQPLTSTDQVNFALTGSFNQSYLGTACQFYKKDGSNTYTVEVEVGWGERDSQIIQQRKIHTISCAYDSHGNALSSSETISDWFLNPWEMQSLLGGNSSASFVLKVIDVLEREVQSDQISIGRKIRLMAEDTGANPVSFRALSCTAQNSASRYYILRAGCGDGLVFPKNAGFETVGNRVYSPYFDAFKLSGPDDTLEFQCRFTECTGACNGDSCSVEFINRTAFRTKRESNDDPEDTVLPATPAFVAKTKPFKTR